MERVGLRGCGESSGPRARPLSTDECISQTFIECTVIVHLGVNTHGMNGRNILIADLIPFQNLDEQMESMDGWR